MDIKVSFKPDKRRLDQLVEALRFHSSATTNQKQAFLQSLKLSSYSRRALEFLQRVFPKSKASTSSVNEFGAHLSAGWKSKVYATLSRIGIQVYHKDEKNRRVRLVLKSLDRGHRAFSYVARDSFVFFGKYAGARSGLVTARSRKGWVTVAEGQVINRGARSGIEYSSRTHNYITNVLVPEMKAEVREKIRRRFERLK